MRNIIFQGLFRIGLNSILVKKRQHQLQVPILVFHRVHPQYDHLTQPIDPKEFERLLDLLIKQYHLLPLSALSDTEDPKACFITFDDATSDFYEFVFPILQSKQIPATLFVPVASIDHQKRIWNNELIYNILFAQNEMATIDLLDQSLHIYKNTSLSQVLGFIEKLNKAPYTISKVLKQINTQLSPFDSDFAMPMSWSQIREVNTNGVEIGNHSYEHLAYDSLSVEEIKKDIALANSRIEAEIGQSPFFAYPMGKIEKVKSSNQDNHQFHFSTESNSVSLNDKKNPISRISLYDRTAEEMMLRIAGLHSMFSI